MTFTLARQNASVTGNASPQAVDEENCMEEQSAAAGPRRVLIADDNDDAAVSLAMLLKTVGYEVATARDGVEAVEKAVAFRPDVVLLDIGMPRMDGYEAARQIRQRLQNVTLVALSGWDEQAEGGTSDATAFDARLLKPVDLDALSNVLEGANAGRTRA